MTQLWRRPIHYVTLACFCNYLKLPLCSLFTWLAIPTFIHQKYYRNIFLISKTTTGTSAFLEETKNIMGPMSWSQNPVHKPWDLGHSSNTYSWSPHDQHTIYLLYRFLLRVTEEVHKIQEHYIHGPKQYIAMTCSKTTKIYHLVQPARAVEYTASLQRVKTPLLNKCPGYDTKQSDSEIPVMLELWGMWSTPSLPSIPEPLWPRVVASDRVLSVKTWSYLPWYSLEKRVFCEDRM